MKSWKRESYKKKMIKGGKISELTYTECGNIICRTVTRTDVEQDRYDGENKFLKNFEISKFRNWRNYANRRERKREKNEERNKTKKEDLYESWKSWRDLGIWKNLENPNIQEIILE